MDDRIKIGGAAEGAVEKFLCERGCVILARNYSDKLGEIDLVAQYKRQILVVEVRSRRGVTFDDCLDSIGGVKRRKIRNTASRWLATQKLVFDEIRFCVAAVLWKGQKADILFIKDAF